ncbi:MAG TPA: transcriptional regulator [Gammaproteobacteria bacterium]|nr:transcriptional regulator [Gammaproteobacteria bacterium]
MHIQGKILKWGNSLALRLSGSLRDIPHFQANMLVNIDVNENGITVQPAKKSKSPRISPFSEAQLLKGLTPHTAHADALAKLSKKESGY